MKINTTNVFYRNDMSNSSTVSGQAKRSVLLTDYSDVLTAINKGTLTVDGVTLELSEDIRTAIDEAREQQFKDCEAVNMTNAAIHNANVAKQQGDVMEEVLDEQAKALEIARRISKGGQVPQKDERLLMDYSPELYQMAKQSALLAKEHKKYKTLIKEDSEESKTYDADEGKLDTGYQIQVEVSMGDTPTVEGVSEVEISSENV